MSAATYFKYLRNPCFVLFAGYPQQMLHSDPTRELIWHEPSGSRLVGAVNYAAVMENGQLKWSVKGHSLGVRKSPRYDLLQGNMPHRGSVTLFSQGEKIIYSKIEIMGQLDPDWFAWVAQRLAGRELEQLMSTAPPPPKATPNEVPAVAPDSPDSTTSPPDAPPAGPTVQLKSPSIGPLPGRQS